MAIESRRDKTPDLIEDDRTRDDDTANEGEL